jgi:hypothetical protein
MGCSTEWDAAQNVAQEKDTSVQSQETQLVSLCIQFNKQRDEGMTAVQLS